MGYNKSAHNFPVYAALGWVNGWVGEWVSHILIPCEVRPEVEKAVENWAYNAV
jgi:hypothetical protein